MMTCLPDHGRIECSFCHRGQPYAFDVTRTEDDGVADNATIHLAWGNPAPEVVVLGFSKAA